MMYNKDNKRRDNFTNRRKVQWLNKSKPNTKKSLNEFIKSEYKEEISYERQRPIVKLKSK